METAGAEDASLPALHDPESAPRSVEDIGKEWLQAAVKGTYLPHSDAMVLQSLTEAAGHVRTLVLSGHADRSAYDIGYLLAHDLQLTPESLAAILACAHVWISSLQRHHRSPADAAGMVVGELVRGTISGTRERVYHEQQGVMQAVLTAHRRKLSPALTESSVFRSRLKRTAVPMAALSPLGVIQDANEAFTQLIPRGNPIGKLLRVLGHTSADREALHTALNKALGMPGQQSWVEITVAGTSATPQTLIAVGLIYDPADSGGGLHLVVDDMTSLQHWSRRPHPGSAHETVTDLPNRRHFLASAKQEMALFSADSSVGICVVRLDNQHEITRKLGQAAADTVINAAALRIIGAIADIRGAFTARLDAASFAVLLPVPDAWVGVMDTVKRMMDWIADPVTVRPSADKGAASAGQVVEICPQVRISVAEGDPARVEAHDLLQRAENALNDEQEVTIRSSCPIARPNSKEQREHNSKLMGLHQAWGLGQIQIAWHPVARVGTRMLAGVQATVEWNHPDFGTIGIDDLVEEADQLKLVGGLLPWIIQQAVHDGARWRRRFGHTAPFVHMPVPLRMAADEALLHHVRSALTDAALEPEHLHLQLPETAIIDEQGQVHPMLEQLCATGVKIAMTGLGINARRLDCLPKMTVASAVIPPQLTALLSPLDIEGSGTVQDGAVSPMRAPAERLIQLCRDLNQQVTVSGVTEQTQLRQAQRLGARHAQGPYFGEPRTAADIEELLENPVALAL